MKRVLLLSPLLLITAITLDRVIVSSAQISIVQSLRSLFIMLFFLVSATLVIQYFLHDWHHTHFLVLMIPVTLVAYRAVYHFLKIRFPIQASYIGLGLLVLLSMLYVFTVHRRVWKFVRNPAQVTAYFNVVCIALFSFQVARLGQDSSAFLKNLGKSRNEAAAVFGGNLKLDQESSPDIYVIVLDGYARQDVLRNIYGYDNSAFVGALEERGFYVASESHSNYVQTPYSMASFWNLDYLQPWDSSNEYAQYLYQPIQDNRVFRSLKEIDYTTVSTEGAVHYTEIRNSDVYLSPFLPLNNFETFLLADSPLEPLSNVVNLGVPLYTYQTHRQRLLFQLDALKRIPAEISGPKIVYTHILAPHPPFVFDQNGGVLEPQRPFTLAEGIDFQGGEAEYVKGYRKQVEFINGEIIKVIDTILLKSDKPPVILIMGDHGPASRFHWKIEDPGCQWERTSNLYAILLPGHEDDNTMYPSVSPVNSFRIIFNTYFGTDLQLLEDRSYMMFWQQPTLNVEITGQRDSLESCSVSDD